MKIVLEHLTKKYPNRNKKVGGEIVAVNDFTFEVPDGKLVGLLGPSGCGKSTTLNMICGLEKPTSGKIYFGDDDVTDLPPETRGVGMVFQSYALYPHLTVRQNIIFPLQNLKGDQKLSKEEMNQKALEAAKLVQIDELMERKPSELSGGQQQRVAIARALVKRPKVLLLDEPLSNLDARLRLQTREEIRRIQRETRITTVFVTHDQEEAMSISDAIVVMSAGEVQQIGWPQDVYDEPENLFVAKFLGTPPINVFNGRVKDGHVYIGDSAIISINELISENEENSNLVNHPMLSDLLNTEKEVYVGIRPEGFIPATDISEGEARGDILTCKRIAVQVMGRDTSVVASHPDFLGEEIRAIVDSETNVDPYAETVSFTFKATKVHLFDKETELRYIPSNKAAQAKQVAKAEPAGQAEQTEQAEQSGNSGEVSHE